MISVLQQCIAAPREHVAGLGRDVTDRVCSVRHVIYFDCSQEDGTSVAFELLIMITRR